MADRERRIQEIAYLLWEGEGRPDGQAERFWHMAEAAYGAEVEITGGDKDEIPGVAAATVLSDVDEVETDLAGEAEAPRMEAPAEAPASRKPATKSKTSSADEDKPKAAKPKAGKAKSDIVPAAAKAADEPALKSAAKSKSKKL